MASRLNPELVDYYLSRLNRDRIFPPYCNDPEKFVPDVTNDRRPPRPSNVFLLLRKNVAEEARRCIERPNMRVISKASSILWALSTQEEKEVYHRLAKDVSDLHATKFPNFTYTQPRRQLSFRSYTGPTPSLPESTSMPTYMSQVEITRELMTPPPSPSPSTHIPSGELLIDYDSANYFEPGSFIIDPDSELYQYIFPYTMD